MSTPRAATTTADVGNSGTPGGGKLPLPTISLALAKFAIAHPPFEDVTVIWVTLVVAGETMVTVRVVEPDPVGPEFTLGVTVTVQAAFDETAVKVISVFALTPAQAKPHDCVVVEPAVTTVERDGGLIEPPHGAVETVATTGATASRANTVRTATNRSVTFVRMSVDSPLEYI